MVDEKEYKRTQYFFTKEEMIRISSMDTISQMGEMAKLIISNMMNNICLPRVKVSNSPDNKVEYDLPSGSFFVYTPKEICMNCKIRKAVYKKGNQNLCYDCLKAQETPPVKPDH